MTSTRPNCSSLSPTVVLLSPVTGYDSPRLSCAFRSAPAVPVRRCAIPSDPLHFRGKSRVLFKRLSGVTFSPMISFSTRLRHRMHPPVETVFRHETVWYTEWIAGKIPILLTLELPRLIS